MTDLKPENIFVTEQLEEQGRELVKIVDFGIAQDATQPRPGESLVDPMGSTGQMPVPTEEEEAELLGAHSADRNRFTIPGTLLGTPLYMSPEQAQRLPTDARSDQYSFGCILYEMLTGTAPFQAGTLSELLDLHIKTSPVPPRRRLPGLLISSRLESLVLRLLEKDREKRFPSMREVEQALHEEIDLLLLERGEKVAVSRQTAARLSDPALAARRRRRFWGSMLLAIVMLCGGVYTWRSVERSHKAVSKETLLPGELLRLRSSAVATLIDLTRTTDPEIRLPAITALGQTREEWLEPALEQLLASPDSETQAQAANALGRLGARAALPTLRALGERTQSAHVFVAVAAARIGLGEAEAERQLEAALGIPDSELAYQAALSLCERRHAKARSLLANRAIRWDLPRPMAVDLWARLVQCGDPAARDKLRAEMVSSEVLDVPILAATKLAQFGDPEGVAFLQRLIERPEYALRALRALAQSGVKVEAEQFRRILEDRTASVSIRVYAAQGLGYVGRPFDARLLGSEMAASSDPRLREALAISILQLSQRPQSA